jgi:hypothetical protein
MHSLRSGQEAVLSWPEGSISCRVIAAAGRFVLLKPERDDPFSSRPHGACSLTYLDGVIPMGFDGDVEPAAFPGEFRFRVGEREPAAERRATARVAADAPVWINVGPDVVKGRLLDLSAGGARFRHASRIGGPGSRVRVITELPDGLRIDAESIVCAAEVGVSSVRFESLYDASAADIGAWTINELRRSLAVQ